MLSRSRESFAAIYSRSEGVRFIPAEQILAIEPEQVYELSSRSLYGFFKSHIKCEVGDRKLNAPTIDALDGLEIGETADGIEDAHIIAMKVSK